MSKKFSKFILPLCAAAVVLTLTACGKGVDAKLQTASEEAYRPSLDKALVDMSTEQQQAYNWAVSDFTLGQLHAKYANATPRRIIKEEADAVIQVQTGQIAAVTADLAKNAERLAREEQAIAAVQQELAQLSISDSKLIKDSFFGSYKLTYVVHNPSRYNISEARWDGWLFINGETESTRHCFVYASFKYQGGLASGKQQNASHDVGSTYNCDAWDTLEVRNASQKVFQFKVIPESVTGFDEKPVLPQSRPSRASYEQKIQQAKNFIEAAGKAKATLT